MRSAPRRITSRSRSFSGPTATRTIRVSPKRCISPSRRRVTVARTKTPAAGRKRLTTCCTASIQTARGPRSRLTGSKIEHAGRHMEQTEFTNHLINESSPYLLQHAHNPVEWYPWGEEALAKARRENKPVLLSIGYSACHWCHVMAHE